MPEMMIKAMQIATAVHSQKAKCQMGVLRKDWRNCSAQITPLFPRMRITPIGSRNKTGPNVRAIQQGATAGGRVFRPFQSKAAQTEQNPMPRKKTNVAVWAR